MMKFQSGNRPGTPNSLKAAANDHRSQFSIERYYAENQYLKQELLEQSREAKRYRCRVKVLERDTATQIRWMERWEERLLKSFELKDPSSRFLEFVRQAVYETKRTRVALVSLRATEETLRKKDKLLENRRQECERCGVLEVALEKEKSKRRPITDEHKAASRTRSPSPTRVSVKGKIVAERDQWRRTCKEQQELLLKMEKDLQVAKRGNQSLAAELESLRKMEHDRTEPWDRVCSAFENVKCMMRQKERDEKEKHLEKERLDNQIAAAENKVHQGHAEVLEAQGEIADLKTRLSTLECDIAKQCRLTETAQGRSVELTTELDAEKKVVAQLTAHAETMERQLSDQTSALRAAEATVAAQHSHLQGMTSWSVENYEKERQLKLHAVEDATKLHAQIKRLVERNRVLESGIVAVIKRMSQKMTDEAKRFRRLFVMLRLQIVSERKSYQRLVKEIEEERSQTKMKTDVLQEALNGICAVEEITPAFYPFLHKLLDAVEPHQIPHNELACAVLRVREGTKIREHLLELAQRPRWGRVTILDVKAATVVRPRITIGRQSSGWLEPIGGVFEVLLTHDEPLVAVELEAFPQCHFSIQWKENDIVLLEYNMVEVSLLMEVVSTPLNEQWVLEVHIESIQLEPNHTLAYRCRGLDLPWTPPPKHELIKTEFHGPRYAGWTKPTTQRQDVYCGDFFLLPYAPTRSRVASFDLMDNNVAVATALLRDGKGLRTVKLTGGAGVVRFTMRAVRFCEHACSTEVDWVQFSQVVLAPSAATAKVARSCSVRISSLAGGFDRFHGPFDMLAIESEVYLGPIDLPAVPCCVELTDSVRGTISSEINPHQLALPTTTLNFGNVQLMFQQDFWRMELIACPSPGLVYVRGTKTPAEPLYVTAGNCILDTVVPKCKFLVDYCNIRGKHFSYPVNLPPCGTSGIFVPFNAPFGAFCVPACAGEVWTLFWDTEKYTVFAVTLSRRFAPNIVIDTSQKDHVSFLVQALEGAEVSATTRDLCRASGDEKSVVNGRVRPFTAKRGTVTLRGNKCSMIMTVQSKKFWECDLSQISNTEQTEVATAVQRYNAEDFLLNATNKSGSQASSALQSPSRPLDVPFTTKVETRANDVHGTILHDDHERKSGDTLEALYVAPASPSHSPELQTDASMSEELHPNLDVLPSTSEVRLSLQKAGAYPTAEECPTEVPYKPLAEAHESIGSVPIEEGVFSDEFDSQTGTSLSQGCASPEQSAACDTEVLTQESHQRPADTHQSVSRASSARDTMEPMMSERSALDEQLSDTANVASTHSQLSGSVESRTQIFFLCGGLEIMMEDVCQPTSENVLSKLSATDVINGPAIAGESASRSTMSDKASRKASCPTPPLHDDESGTGEGLQAGKALAQIEEIQKYSAEEEQSERKTWQNFNSAPTVAYSSIRYARESDWLHAPTTALLDSLAHSSASALEGTADQTKIPSLNLPVHHDSGLPGTLDACAPPSYDERVRKYSGVGTGTPPMVQPADQDLVHADEGIAQTIFASAITEHNAISEYDDTAQEIDAQFSGTMFQECTAYPSVYVTEKHLDVVPRSLDKEKWREKANFGAADTFADAGVGGTTNQEKIGTDIGPEIDEAMVEAVRDIGCLTCFDEQVVESLSAQVGEAEVVTDQAMGCGSLITDAFMKPRTTRNTVSKGELAAEHVDEALLAEVTEGAAEHGVQELTEIVGSSGTANEGVPNDPDVKREELKEADVDLIDRGSHVHVDDTDVPQNDLTMEIAVIKDPHTHLSRLGCVEDALVERLSPTKQSAVVVGTARGGYSSITDDCASPHKQKLVIAEFPNDMISSVKSRTATDNSENEKPRRESTRSVSLSKTQTWGLLENNYSTGFETALPTASRENTARRASQPELAEPPSATEQPDSDVQDDVRKRCESTLPSGSRECTGPEKESPESPRSSLRTFSKEPTGSMTRDNGNERCESVSPRGSRECPGPEKESPESPRFSLRTFSKEPTGSMTRDNGNERCESVSPRGSRGCAGAEKESPESPRSSLRTFAKQPAASEAKGYENEHFVSASPRGSRGCVGSEKESPESPRSSLRTFSKEPAGSMTKDNGSKRCESASPRGSRGCAGAEKESPESSRSSLKTLSKEPTGSMTEDYGNERCESALPRGSRECTGPENETSELPRSSLRTFSKEPTGSMTKDNGNKRCESASPRGSGCAGSEKERAKSPRFSRRTLSKEPTGSMSKDYDNERFVSASPRSNYGLAESDIPGSESRPSLVSVVLKEPARSMAKVDDDERLESASPRSNFGVAEPENQRSELAWSSTFSKEPTRSMTKNDGTECFESGSPRESREFAVSEKDKFASPRISPRTLSKEPTGSRTKDYGNECCKSDSPKGGRGCTGSGKDNLASPRCTPNSRATEPTRRMAKADKNESCDSDSPRGGRGDARWEKENPKSPRSSLKTLSKERGGRMTKDDNSERLESVSPRGSAGHAGADEQKPGPQRTLLGAVSKERAVNLAQNDGNEPRESALLRNGLEHAGSDNHKPKSPHSLRSALSKEPRACMTKDDSSERFESFSPNASLDNTEGKVLNVDAFSPSLVKKVVKDEASSERFESVSLNDGCENSARRETKAEFACFLGAAKLSESVSDKDFSKYREDVALENNVEKVTLSDENTAAKMEREHEPTSNTLRTASALLVDDNIVSATAQIEMESFVSSQRVVANCDVECPAPLNELARVGTTKQKLDATSMPVSKDNDCVLEPLKMEGSHGRAHSGGSFPLPLSYASTMRSPSNVSHTSTGSASSSPRATQALARSSRCPPFASSTASPTQRPTKLDMPSPNSPLLTKVALGDHTPAAQDLATQPQQQRLSRTSLLGSMALNGIKYLRMRASQRVSEAKTLH